MVTAQFYRSDMKTLWDRFVDDSKTPLFMFKRDFMEYHADRFQDCSLIFMEGAAVVGLLPASRHADLVISHGGLTYGGLLVKRTARSIDAAACLAAAKDFLHQQGVTNLRYKTIPSIFHRQPAGEDLYFLTNRFAATLVRRDISSVIPLSDSIKFSHGRISGVTKARKAGVVAERSYDWAEFHSILQQALSRHEAAPVHSVDELFLLAQKFPENIQLYLARQDGVAMAGAMLFLFEGVMHTQYLAATESGRSIGALDFLLDNLITTPSPGIQFFSFGISTENNGTVLNEGLLSQKEGFGARAITIDCYEMPIGPEASAQA